MAHFNSAQTNAIPIDSLFSAATTTSKSATNSRSPHLNLRSAHKNASSTMSNAAQQLVITHSKDWWSIISEFVLIGGSLAALGYMFKSLIAQQTDPEQNRKAIAEHCKRVLLKKMKKSGRKITSFNTNTYEDSLLDLIVLPASIEVKFSDIGGLEPIKRDLTETVLVPLIYPQLTGSSRLCAPPLGVLFHGPPGTGKSMMAKAIARETNATFFNVDMSRLMSKWYGDSQKYISALFSLARKMAPSIIWIDEIDALFSQRSRSDHSADVYNKALFLSLWDGLANDIYKPGKINKRSMGMGRDNETAQVIIFGASNRPQQVDEAFLRRMSRQYEFTMPDDKTRKLILKILLKTEKIHKNVALNVIASKTQLYSGSDLKELCKYAATLPLREYVRKKSSNPCTPDGRNGYNRKKGWFFNANSSTPGDDDDDGDGDGGVHGKNINVMNVFENQKEHFILRAIEQNDLLTALKHIKSTLKAHNDHKMKYGTNSTNSLFNNLGLFGYNGAAQFNNMNSNKNNDNNRNVSNINIKNDAYDDDGHYDEPVNEDELEME